MRNRLAKPQPRSALMAWVSYLTACLIAVAFVLPLVWVIAASLRQPGLAPPPTIEWLPRPISWSNYRRIFALLPLERYLLNSLIVVGMALPLTVVTASWAGLAMAQLAERVQQRLLVLAVIVLMVPSTALWLTRYVLFSYLRVIDSFVPLIAGALMGTNPFCVLLFYWAFRRLSPELYASARLDGAGALRVWWSVAMPLARRTTLVVAMLAFSLYWSDFISPLLYLKSESRYTLPVGLQLFQQMDRTNWPLLMAAAVLMTAPVVVLFLLIQHVVWPEERRGYGER